jgi:phytoene synthase
LTTAVARSYALCETVARRQAGNFYPAFRVLPTGQRRSMCALYAFLRMADDISDEPGELAVKQRQLDQWRAGLDRALAGEYTHALYPALHHTVFVHAIPPHYLHAALDGVGMDLWLTAYNTFDDLRKYCYHVASVVGLACIHIWGFSDRRATHFAELAGIAFQLTNILRDLGEDAARPGVLAARRPRTLWLRSRRPAPG